MFRRVFAIAAAAAFLIPLADVAVANQIGSHSGGGLHLRIGPVQFHGGPAPRIWIDRRRGVEVGRRGAPVFPYDTFENDYVAVTPVEGDYGFLPPQDRTRARLLDQDLGAALEALRRDMGHRNGAALMIPEPNARRVEEEIEVTRLPEAGTQPAPAAKRFGVIIEEEAVIGPLTLLDGSEASVKPVTSVGTASVSDVVTHGPAAFAVLSHPDALGLSQLPTAQSYYVLNGKVVTLDAEAQRALTVAAFEAALR